MKYFSVAVLMLFLSSPASAEDCRKYPPGPFDLSALAPNIRV